MLGWMALVACTPALVKEGRRASESGDWVLAHRAWTEAAQKYEKHPEYRDYAEAARPKAIAWLVDAAAARMDAGDWDSALSLVDDALALGGRDAADRLRPRLADATRSALARGDVELAWRRIPAVNERFPGGADPRAPEIVAWMTAEADRRIEAGKYRDAVALWDVATRAGRDVTAEQAGTRRAATTAGIAASRRAFESGQADRGLALWDEARGLAPAGSTEGTAAPFPALFLAAGRASADPLLWASRLEARFPGRSEAAALRDEGRRRVAADVDALVARGEFDAAVRLPAESRAKDPAFDWRPLEDHARTASAAALVSAANAELAAGHPDAALSTLERAASFRPPGGLVRSTDPLPRQLAAAGEARLSRPLDAYDFGGRLLAIFPGNAAVQRLLDRCHDDLRDAGRRAYFDGRIADADAIFARIGRVEPGIDVASWRARARADATGDALLLAVRTIDGGDPVMALGWVDLAMRIGGDDPATRTLWGQAVDRLYGAAPRLVARQGPASAYELVRDLDERFPGSIQSGAAIRGVREATFEGARRHAEARRWDQALAILEVVRRYEPGQGYAVDLERAHVLDRWSASVQEEARSAWTRQDVGSAWVLVHRADRIAGRETNPMLSRSIAEDLARLGPVIGWTLDGGRGSESERAFRQALTGGPSLQVRPGSPGPAAGVIDYDAGCRTEVTSREQAIHQYLGPPEQRPSPDWTAADQQARDADAARRDAETRLPAARSRVEAAKRTREQAVADRTRADGALDAAETALIEAKTAVGVAAARVAESDAAAARIAGSIPTEADRTAARAAVEAAKRDVEAARAAQRAAADAWRAIQPACVAGTADPAECAAKRESLRTAREAASKAEAALSDARTKLAGVEAALSGGTTDAALAADLGNRKAALDAANAALAPKQAAYDRAKAAVRAADEAVRAAEAELRAATAALAELTARLREATAARDAAIARRDSLPRTVTVRPTREAPYTIEHVARICAVDVGLSGTTPSRQPMPPLRAEARDESIAVHADPAIDLAAKIPDFRRDDAARLRDADHALAGRLGDWTRSELDALRTRVIAEAASTSDPDDATTRWLVAFWLDPRRMPDGMERFFATRWPDVPAAALAP